MKATLVTLVSIGLFLSVPSGSEIEDALARRASLAKVADKLNPVFEALRPTAKRIQTLDRSDHAAIAEACLSKDEQLSTIRLQRALFNEIEARSLPSIPWIAEIMLDSNDERMFCSEQWLKTSGPQQCSEWCIGIWGELSELVDELRREAQQLGVTISTLR